MVREKEVAQTEKQQQSAGSGCIILAAILASACIACPVVLALGFGHVVYHPIQVLAGYVILVLLLSITGHYVRRIRRILGKLDKTVLAWTAVAYVVYQIPGRYLLLQPLESGLRRLAAPLLGCPLGHFVPGLVTSGVWASAPLSERVANVLFVVFVTAPSLVFHGGLIYVAVLHVKKWIQGNGAELARRSSSEREGQPAAARTDPGQTGVAKKRLLWAGIVLALVLGGLYCPIQRYEVCQFSPQRLEVRRRVRYCLGYGESCRRAFYSTSWMSEGTPKLITYMQRNGYLEENPKPTARPQWYPVYWQGWGWPLRELLDFLFSIRRKADVVPEFYWWTVLQAERYMEYTKSHPEVAERALTDAAILIREADSREDTEWAGSVLGLAWHSETVEAYSRELKYWLPEEHQEQLGLIPGEPKGSGDTEEPGVGGQ